MKGNKKFKPKPGAKLMEQVREVLRYHHYAVQRRHFKRMSDFQTNPPALNKCSPQHHDYA